MDTDKFITYFSSLVLLVLAFFLWAFLAPYQLGGNASYVIVEGVSMLPTYRAGDLVISRSSSSYQVGDVITYNQPDFGMYIIHRIVGTENGRYITQGDNVATPDTYRPSSENIIGKTWLHIPFAGNIARTLKNPFYFSLAVGALLLFSFRPLNKSTLGGVQRRKKRMLQETTLDVDMNQLHSKLPKGIELMIPILAIIFIISLGVLIWSVSTPYYVQGEPLRYYQVGQFSYTTNAASGIYDYGSAQTGDPIFTKINCNINLDFAYAIMGDYELSNVAGSYALYMQIADPNSGWKKTIPLIAPTAFSGQNIRLQNNVDLCQVITVMQQYEGETGARQATYLYNIIAQVNTAGLIQNVPFQENYSASLNFVFDRNNFYVDRSDPAVDPFRKTTESVINNPFTTPNSISVAGIPIRISIISILSLFVAGGIGIALVYLITLMNRVIEQDIETKVRLMYGVMIADASDIILKLAPIIELDSIDQLAKLAANQNSAILRTYYLNSVYYTLRVGEISYRYIQEKYKVG